MTDRDHASMSCAWGGRGSVVRGCPKVQHDQRLGSTKSCAGRVLAMQPACKRSQNNTSIPNPTTLLSETNQDHLMIWPGDTSSSPLSGSGSVPGRGRGPPKSPCIEWRCAQRGAEHSGALSTAGWRCHAENRSACKTLHPAAPAFGLCSASSARSTQCPNKPRQPANPCALQTLQTLQTLSFKPLQIPPRAQPAVFHIVSRNRSAFTSFLFQTIHSSPRAQPAACAAGSPGLR